MAQRKPKRWKLKIRKYTINIFYRGRTRPCNRHFCGGKVFPSKESKKTGVCQACGRTAPSPLLWYPQILGRRGKKVREIMTEINKEVSALSAKNVSEPIQSRSLLGGFLKIFD
jgi:hypothetical protein